MRREVTDQMGRSLLVPVNPRRIVSLVPSQTELLFDLGVQDQLVGVTNFCIHPAQKPGHILKVGGTKTVDIDKLEALRPDLIIANKEENEQSVILEMSKRWPVC